MKAGILVILAVLGALAVSGCGASKTENVEIENGFYTVKDNDAGAYVCFDTEAGTWRSGAGIAISYAVSGTYETGKDAVALKTGEGTAAAELRPEEGKALSVAFSDETLVPWLRAGDVLEARGESPVPQLFETVCSADEGLALARQCSAVVMEKLSCTSGREVWDGFVEAVRSGGAASVTLAQYWPEDGRTSGTDPEYPMLYLYRLDHDGESFRVTGRVSTEEDPEYSETFKYLLRFESGGEKTAERFVLTDDDTVTWEQIERDMLSSQFGDSIKHCTVFYDTEE